MSISNARGYTLGINVHNTIKYFLRKPNTDITLGFGVGGGGGAGGTRKFFGMTPQNRPPSPSPKIGQIWGVWLSNFSKSGGGGVSNAADFQSSFQLRIDSYFVAGKAKVQNPKRYLL